MTTRTATSEMANERFKRRFGDTVWVSVCAAVLVHAAVLALFPSMSVADMGFEGDPLTAIDLPPEIVIPPPPEEIARPATPVISEVADVDVEFAPTVLDANPANRPLPPPPVTSEGRRELENVPHMVPMTVRPELANRAEVQRELERRYPRLLRESGIGGAPVIWFFIDEEGRVQKTQLKESSGYALLDEAALAVGRIMRFRPAKNMDRFVAVWVFQPITFESK